MKILNLYAGIGGNRMHWGNEHEVTAVELDFELAAIYKEQFPGDVVLAEDALEVLLDSYAEYDFIWASPPCPTHGQYRYNVGVRAKGYKPVIPEMTSLYGVLTFLEHHYEGLYAVENVIPYYKPLIQPTVKLQRHLVWSNFPIAEMKVAAKGVRSKNKISDFGELAKLVEGRKISNKRQVLRNCVDPALGDWILRAAEKSFNDEQG